MTRREQAFAYFISMGWTPEQAAGIVANLEAESGLRPDAVGDGGLAYGIAQWHPDRQAGFSALMGKPIQGSTFEDQLAWVHAELNGPEKPAGDALRACTTAAEAGACVSQRYERPADKEGEARKRAALAEQIIAWAVPAATVSPTAPRSPQTPDFGPILTFGGKMLPLLLPAAIQLIPQLISIFGKSGERAQQNAQAAQAVADAVVKVTGAPNLQGGIEAMQADPAVKAAATAAVLQEPAIASLLEVTEAGGGGIAGARKAASEPGMPPFWKTAPFWISILLLGIVYAVVGSVLFQGSGWRPEDKAQVLMLAIAVTSGVMGYFLGSSIGSARKDQLLERK